MKKRFFSCIGWGAHINGFSLVRAFNNLAPWGEIKFVRELKRTYKFKRGVNRYTEDNSPKYRMVGKMISTLRSFAVQTRILSKKYNIMAGGYVRSTAQDDKNLNKLRNKCAIVCVGSSFRHWCGAFTLAEVLVTLGIIGVVSAMTVPTLMQNYQRQSYVTQLHKTYNEFSQALLRYQTDRNAINLSEAGLSSQDAVNNFITTYFKNVKECDAMNNCFASSYKGLDGSTIDNYKVDVKSYVLASGVSIRPYYLKSGAKLVNIGIDINGQKGPNIGGRDLFWFYVYNNGVIDDYPIDANTVAPMTSAERDTQFTTYCNSTADGCFGKILNDNWQMTY